jgi:UDP-N-acetylglucosamine diphosphorylase / glucose-1-phosphate thymidylyltransferase / UDP-N-acetylgalactosamine diphosphorylase / glucosamine-1-phosphate N-acetyltransferase / galactosamine-1-phosphate N-acetyltransferase
MNICLFEDREVLNLEPLTLTRPVYELWCGAAPMAERQTSLLPFGATGALVRPGLAETARMLRPNWVINDTAWLKSSSLVLVNARWLPPAGFTLESDGVHGGYIGDELVYAVVPQDAVARILGEPDWDLDRIDKLLAPLKQDVPRSTVGGVLMRYLWDIVDANPQAISDDFHGRPRESRADAGIDVVGPRELLAVDPSAQVDPFVVADTRKGPVMIGRGAIIQSFTRLEGPCYVGPESWLLGAKLRGGTIGPKCRVGGEFEASIVQGHSNKYHDGFLGHSYIGEWVNLAAGTQTSDLRNDYGPIRVGVNGRRVPTGRNKIGSYVGDHTKSGLNTLLNCGSSVGVFCNLLPTGSYLPNTIPSFTLCNTVMSEQWDLRQLFQTASIAMGRRGQELTDVHTDLFFTLFETTAEARRQIHRDHEQRRLRRSM